MLTKVNNLMKKEIKLYILCAIHHPLHDGEIVWQRDVLNDILILALTLLLFD